MADQKVRRIYTAERHMLARGAGEPAARFDAGGSAAPGASGEEFRSTLEAFKGELIKELRTMFGLVEEEKSGEMSQSERQLSDAQAEVQRLKEEQTMLRTEIRALSRAIEQTKFEVAALYKSEDTDNRMAVVQHELDSVVNATEDATGRILEAVETADQAAHNIRDSSQDPYVQRLTEEISEQVTRVFEAANFQDLTGQRLNKVVNTLKYVEERVASVIEIWGDEEIEAVEAPDLPKGPDDLAKTVDRKFENVERISQEDIDKMFD